MNVRKGWSWMTVAGLCALLLAAPGYAQEDGDMGPPGGGEGGEEKPKKKKEKPVKKEGEAKKKGERKAPVLEELTLTGKLAKAVAVAKEGAKKAAGERYVLTLEDGTKVSLPTPRQPRKGKGKEKEKKEGEAAKEKPAAIKLADYDGKSVTVVGMGAKMVQKKGDKEVTRYMVKQIKSITEAGGG